MFTLYQRCLACICRRSRCRASPLTGTREACRVVSVGQNWRLDCNSSLHSAAELVPGRSIDTVSFCGWAPCHAEAALCEYTSCSIPSSRMGNFFVMSSSSMASQSTLAFATKRGWKPSALMFHFWIRHVTSRGPRAPGSFFPVKDVWVPYYRFLRQTSRITCLNGFNDRGAPAGREPDIKNVHHIDGSKPFLEVCEQAFLFGFPRLFPLPPGRLSSVLQITFTNPLAARLSSIDLLGRCLDAVLSISL